MLGQRPSPVNTSTAFGQWSKRGPVPVVIEYGAPFFA
jgi:hypothetical protein